MKTIVITLPHFFSGEAAQIVQLLQGQVDLVHIRKPEATAAEVEKLIREIPAGWHGSLVLHDHHELALRYSLHGVHLNSRNPLPPEGWTGSVSRSCHSLEEVAEWKKRCDYVSLSPIFDSISKRGYHSAFTAEEIREARDRGIIDDKVMALGGVTFGKLDDVLRMGFGGAMILGDAWKGVSAELTPVALTIAGSDSSAGAGIQQDLKTMESVGVYCATVITAITSQNTMGITGVMPVGGSVVESQLKAVLSDLNVKTVKIGMVPDAGVAHVIAASLREYKAAHDCHVVYDPVMISTSGRRLMAADCLDVVVEELMPLCTLVTPNIPEAEFLAAKTGIVCEGGALADALHTSILIKGGHSDGEVLADSLFNPDGSSQSFKSERIDTRNLHGTGCTLSSAIAAFLLKGHDIPSAIPQAKALLAHAIMRGKDAGIGKGNGPILPGKQ